MATPNAPGGEPDFVTAFQRLIGAVFRLNGHLLKTAESLSADLDISTGRWTALGAIRHKPMTVSQIARRIGVSRQSARQTVQRLEQGDLIVYKTNPDHRRSPLVVLTAAGADVVDVLRERQANLTNRFTKGLGLTADSIDDLTARLENLRVHAEELDEQDNSS
jgi:DNA-binding MarR family transcriptional regulator